MESGERERHRQRSEEGAKEEGREGETKAEGGKVKEEEGGRGEGRYIEWQRSGRSRISAPPPSPHVASAFPSAPSRLR